MQSVLGPFSAGILFLLVSAASASVMQIILRIAQTNGRNMMTIISANYFAASILCYEGFSIFASKGPSFFTLSLGVIMGLAFMTALVISIVSFNQRGAALTGVIVQLGIIIPTLMSVFVWAERITALQAGGIILTLVSLPLVIMKKTETGTIGRYVLLTAILLFLMNGVCRASSKLLLEAGYAAELIPFNFVLFGSACIASVPLAIRTKIKSSHIDLGYGSIVGILNATNNLTLIAALTTIPGSTTFPMFSIVSTLLLIIMAVGLLHEKINKMNWVGVAVSIIAVVLLSM